MKTEWILVLAAALALPCAVRAAGGVDGGEAPPPEGVRPQRPEGGGRGGRGARGDRRGRGRGQRGSRVPGADQVNVVDASYFLRADAALRAEDRAKAIELLTTVIEKSPDEDAKNFARLALARLYMGGEEEDKAKAPALLAAVHGWLGVRARGMEVAELLGARDFAGAAPKVEEAIAKATDVEEKAGLIRLVAQLLSRADDAEALVAFLEKVPELITYEEAMEAAKLAAARPQTPDLARAAQQFMAAGGAEQMVNRFREMGRQRLEGMEAEAKKLEEAGKLDEAAKIRARIERMKEWAERMRGRGGRRRPGGEAGPRPPEPPEGEGGGEGDLF